MVESGSARDGGRHEYVCICVWKSAPFLRSLWPKALLEDGETLGDHSRFRCSRGDNRRTVGASFFGVGAVPGSVAGGAIGLTVGVFGAIFSEVVDVPETAEELAKPGVDLLNKRVDDLNDLLDKMDDPDSCPNPLRPEPE